MNEGRHVKVLGRGVPALLEDVAVVKRTIIRLVEAVEMRLLSEPIAFEVKQEIKKLNKKPFEDEGGVTSVGVLSTSHCAIHTWPLRPFFVLDLYSCRDFQSDKVKDVLVEELRAYNMLATDLSASLTYPDDW
jgi:S-adenosylmethionine/arginine decarboxylase-like enzyme